MSSEPRAALALLCALAVLGLTRRAGAEPAPATERTCEQALAASDGGALRPPPPEFVSALKPTEPDDLALKHEGTYVTGLPLFASDPDTGWGFGAQGFIFWDGPCTDPLYAFAPYRHRLSIQIWATTNGYQQHELSYDAPYLFGTAFRLRADAYYELNTAENYFGRGASTMNNLGFTAAGGQTFPTFDAYTTALSQIRPGGLADTLYNKYRLQDPTLHTTVERTLLGGKVRAQAGFALQYVSVTDYSGTATQGDDPTTGATGVPATMGTTRLAEDCAAHRIVGCSGGWNNTVKAGIAYDSRDFEPDPNRGVFAEATAEAASRVLGSNFDYARMTLSWRGFYSPLPTVSDIVLAGRVMFSAQTAGTPFFSMNTLAFTDGDQQGLGGVATLRGYHQDRFVGAISTLATGELRWTFIGFSVLGQDFGLQLVPFVEAGRVYDQLDQLSPAGWKSDVGAGLHVIWNKSTVIVFDYGVSDEDQSFYVNFGEQF